MREKVNLERDKGDKRHKRGGLRQKSVKIVCFGRIIIKGVIKGEPPSLSHTKLP